jgi:hypothetical protein
MPFKKGQPRPTNAGKKKGTLNKKTLALAEKAEQLGVDPFTILLLVANMDWKALGYDSATRTKYVASGDSYEEDIIQMSDRVNAAKEASKYLYPQRKAIEHTGEIAFTNFAEAMKLALKDVK